MGRRCCVTGCNSTSRLPEHHGVTYHTFPLDPAIRSVWLRNTRMSAEKQITKSVLVCSRHFRRADFHPQRSGKYLLKQRVFPTVFPWGKIDPTQVDADLEALKSFGNSTPSTANASPGVEEDTTKATVEATVAQIMAETAELNAAAGAKPDDAVDGDGGGDGASGDKTIGPPAPVNASATTKFEAVAVFNPGARLEAQDFNGVWHTARVVEVDNDDREVLIRFERSNVKTKSAATNTEEWIPMNSTRLRQKITKNIPVFELEEKCMARWSGPRKFPGTVKKVLSNDMYEVLFDDGYVKNVRAIHMSRLATSQLEDEPQIVAAPVATSTPAPASASAVSPTQKTTTTLSSASATPIAKSTKREAQQKLSTAKTPRKRYDGADRKDWKLLDTSKLDLASLNLPEIPRDGEWTCHWVNDQPIGREGFLIVGEHRKPTVIVEDWRLPPGWVKHMYQRSNVLGKWDVILVSPNNKRFRSKADLKVYLEEHDERYNPDIYDFSIHRRRAKDINAYVYTPDYTPQQVHKTKPVLDTPTNESTAHRSTPSLLSRSSEYMETPVATPMPPMELMTSPPRAKSIARGDTDDVVISKTEGGMPTVEDGYAYIGGLKVQIVDNLFHCPQENCQKNFRKENHLQIHVKHYHQDLIKLLGECPKMLDLAEKRTHPIKLDQNEPTPKNQIPNQEFFAKLHQQDLQHTRGNRKGVAGGTPIANLSPLVPDRKDKRAAETADFESTDVLISGAENELATAGSSIVEHSVASSTADESAPDTPVAPPPSKRSRFSPSKRATGSRKSSRQRTTRRYLTAAQATVAQLSADSSFAVSDFEDTRHSFNATPDAKLDVRKRKHAAAATAAAAPATPLSSVDSPMTADSRSSPFQMLQAPSSNEPDAAQQQYIKENGELIKIVRMRQEEIINCLCSYGEEDGLMIQCELCLCWQHGFCNGIDKEADVPEKYVCYICRNPQLARESKRFQHDQDWLYEGKLPVAKYHAENPAHPKRFELLKKSHTLTGNLIELKRFMHSLRVKIKMANNRCHPKLYLWATKWDDDDTVPKFKHEVKPECDDKTEEDVHNQSMRSPSVQSLSSETDNKTETSDTTVSMAAPNVPQPEAPIDPEECQQRLLEHINAQHAVVEDILSNIESRVDEIEKEDDLPDLKDADHSTVKDTLATFIREMDVLKQIAKINLLEHAKTSTPAAVGVK